MRRDFSNGAGVVAVITMVYNEYVFDAQDEEAIADFLCKKIGSREDEVSGAPVYIEAASWCSLAGIGEAYEDEEFDIYIDEI